MKYRKIPKNSDTRKIAVIILNYCTEHNVFYTVVGYTCYHIVFYLRVVFFNIRNKVILVF